jgi:chromatin remodeling complex protein RSC6
LQRPVKVEKVKKPRKTPNSTGGVCAFDLFTITFLHAVPRNSGYSKHLLLSDALSSLVGADKVICEFHSIAIDAQLARHDVVKRVWAIIKEKNMYDPKNRQFVICDEAFTKVFSEF